MKKVSLFLVLMAAILTARAQSQSYDTTARYFLIEASVGGVNEIVSGRVAAQNAADQQVKDFARQMITDHSKAQNELLAVAKQQGIDLPVNATATPMPSNVLKNASAQDFDRLYVHMMVSDHRETIQLFQTYALMGMNPAVKAYAQQTLPSLKEHLMMITAIEDRMKYAAAK